MKAQTLWIPGKIPSRNELDWMQRRYRIGHNKRRSVRLTEYDTFKQGFELKLRMHSRKQGIESVGEGTHCTYLFVEQNRRRDPSNFSSAGMKLVEDGLVRSGILPNDGWKHIASISLHWIVGKPFGALVCLADRGMSREEMLEQWKAKSTYS